MNHVYKNHRMSGIVWAIAFIMIATLTVATCLKQERLLAERSSIIVAMRSGSLQ